MVWNAFVRDQCLTEQQQAQFIRYKELLIQWNERMNLTSITTEDQIVLDHFYDSVALSQFLDFSKITSLCDIGSGAGFPGVPLKIMFPYVKVILLEVRQKRIEFLQMLCTELGLTNIEVCSLDLRSFLRTSEYEIDLFCARASLQPDELVRIFNPGCRYRQATLVYWASANWQPDAAIQPFMSRICTYQVGDKKRQYVLLQAPSEVQRNKELT